VSEFEHMSCRELVETITEYLERSLPRADLDRFESHLQICDGCRHYLSQMKTTVAALRSLYDDRLQAAQRDELVNLFHGWKRG
jgi:anti-sigma factor RsiW